MGKIIGIIVIGFVLLGGGAWWYVTQNTSDGGIVPTQSSENYIPISESLKTELIKQERDSTRVINLGTLRQAIGMYIVDANFSESLCKTGTIHNSTNGSDAVDGTGWLPVDLHKISGGSPLRTLPKDPINNKIYHYSFACSPNSYDFEINATMESEGYNKDGSGVVFTDGGDNPHVYEVGRGEHNIMN